MLRHALRLLRAAQPWRSTSHRLAHALCPFPVTVLCRPCALSICAPLIPCNFCIALSSQSLVWAGAVDSHL